ncbi:MAG: SAM-dependent methyltransferase [Clostridia bacterium]|nr:SAM-dependent methyltransferase [Clostridia bacterium]
MTTLQQNKLQNIGKRLKTVAEIAAVRLSCEENAEGLYAVDVGTDHAKLPLFLLSKGDFCHITCTDINEGPCRAAEENIRSAGKFYAERTHVVKTDGLTGLDGIKINRVIIAGMGGELIVHILSDAEFVRREKEKIGFVLQPQSKEHILRRYLCENGYLITDEKRVEDAGKLYCVISAVYDGMTREYSLLEQYFGKQGLSARDELFRKAFLKKYTVLKNNINARSGKKDACREDVFLEEEKLFCEMKEYIERECPDADLT